MIDHDDFHVAFVKKKISILSLNWINIGMNEWMVFYVTFDSFSVISWRCLLVTDITGVTT